MDERFSIIEGIIKSINHNAILPQQHLATLCQTIDYQFRELKHTLANPRPISNRPPPARTQQKKVKQSTIPQLNPRVLLNSKSIQAVKKIVKEQKRSQIAAKAPKTASVRKGQIVRGTVARPRFVLPKEIRNNPFAQFKLPNQILQQKSAYDLLNMMLIKHDNVLQTYIINKVGEKETRTTTQIKPRAQSLSPFITETPAPPRPKSTAVKRQIGQKLYKQIIVANGKIIINQDFKVFKQECELNGSWDSKSSTIKYTANRMKQVQKITNFSMIVVRIPDFDKNPSSLFPLFIKDWQKLTSFVQRISGSGGLQLAINKIKSYYKMVRMKRIYQKSKRLQSIKLVKNSISAYVLRSKTYKTIFNIKNSKAELYGELQRRFFQEFDWTQPHVQIHIPNLFFPSNVRKSYFRHRQRQLMMMSRALGNYRQWINIIYIMPYGCPKSTEYLLTLLQKIDKKARSRIKIVLPKLKDKSYEGFSADMALYCSLSDLTIRTIKSLIQDQRAVIVPYSNSKFLMQISAILEVPILGGQLQNNYYDHLYQQFQPDQSGFWNQQNNSHLKFSSSQINFYVNKIRSLTFAFDHFFYSAFKVRQFLQEAGLQLIQARAFQNTSHSQIVTLLAELILQNKNITRWLFKLNSQKFGRGCAWVQTHTIKILNQYRKTGKHDPKVVHAICEFIFNEKLNLAQPFLYTPHEFRDKLAMGGIIEAYQEGSQSYQLCFMMDSQTQHYLGIVKKIETSKCVCNLYAYQPQAPEEMVVQARKAARAVRSLVRVTGIIAVNIVEFKGKFSVMGLDFGMGNSLSGLQMFKFLQGPLKRYAFYCPFIEHQGLRNMSIENFYQHLRKFGVNFDVQNRLGTLFFFLSQRAQFLSVCSIKQNQYQAIKELTVALNTLLNLSSEIVRFDLSTSGEGVDSLYIMDVVGKVKEVCRQLEKQQRMMI